jgi:Na+/H+-translocating membrane pyrophosphatase
MSRWAVELPQSSSSSECFNFSWNIWQVGDNVGDCAARGADLFESIAAEVISAMILGGSMVKRCKLEGQSLIPF